MVSHIEKVTSPIAENWNQIRDDGFCVEEFRNAGGFVMVRFVAENSHGRRCAKRSRGVTL